MFVIYEAVVGIYLSNAVGYFGTIYDAKIYLTYMEALADCPPEGTIVSYNKQPCTALDPFDD